MARRNDLTESHFKFENDRASGGVVRRLDPIFARDCSEAGFGLRYTGTKHGNYIFAFVFPERLLSIDASSFHGHKRDIAGIFLLWELYSRHINFFGALRQSPDSTIDLSVTRYTGDKARISVNGKIFIANPKLLTFLFPDLRSIAKAVEAAYKRTDAFCDYITFNELPNRFSLYKKLQEFAGTNEFPPDIDVHLTYRVLDTLLIKIDEENAERRQARRESFRSGRYYSTAVYTSAEVTGDDSDQYIS